MRTFYLKFSFLALQLLISASVECSEDNTLRANTCSPKAKIALIRHGEAESNVNRINNSDPSNPNYSPSNLTSKGKAQVEKAAKQLLGEGFTDQNIAAVYVSPLPRTRQTAEILANNGVFSLEKIKIDPRLTEIQFGDAEGKPLLVNFEEMPPEFFREKHMETLQHFNERVDDFFHSLIDSNPCGNVIVVTHALVARELDAAISHKDPSLIPDNGVPYVLDLYSAPAVQHEAR